MLTLYICLGLKLEYKSCAMTAVKTYISVRKDKSKNNEKMTYPVKKLTETLLQELMQTISSLQNSVLKLKKGNNIWSKYKSWKQSCDTKSASQ